MRRPTDIRPSMRDRDRRAAMSPASAPAVLLSVIAVHQVPVGAAGAPSQAPTRRQYALIIPNLIRTQ